MAVFRIEKTRDYTVNRRFLWPANYTVPDL